MKKTQVTIGIAAYNEEKNILSLLKNLLSQSQKNFLLEKIFVVSDGSNDNTLHELKKIKDKKIIVRNNVSRQGKAASLNQIFKESTSDILVLMDADITIKDKQFLEKLINPVKEKSADVAAAKVMELPVKNAFQRMLLLSMTIKKDIFEMYNNGRNIYTCHGRALAMSKNMYKKLRFPKGLIADDAYIYLSCMKKKLGFAYVREAKVYYALPVNIEDHQKQSHRFLSTQKQLYSLFGETKTKQEYHLPYRILGKVVLKYVLKDPMMLFHYGLVYSRSKITSLINQPTIVQWETAHSSKSL